MKTMRLLLLASAILLLGANLLLCPHIRFWNSKTRDLKLWMTYDEVSKVVPHDRDRLTRNPMADAYSKNDEERKKLPVFGLDIEYEYGLVLGFNENLELVLINRITRARICHPSGGVPVMRQ